MFLNLFIMRNIYERRRAREILKQAFVFGARSSKPIICLRVATHRQTPCRVGRHWFTCPLFSLTFQERVPKRSSSLHCATYWLRLWLVLHSPHSGPHLRA